MGLDGVEIVVDVDCQESKVGAGMAKKKLGVRAGAETEFQNDERRTFGHRNDLESGGSEFNRHASRN